MDNFPPQHQRPLPPGKRPTSPAADWILLALADGPAHGGAIADRVVGDTLGEYIPSTTLYRLLEGLAEAGFIKATHSPHHYRLTSQGRRRLLWQGRLWERVGHLVNQRLR